jgi:hypothetical protein
VGWFKTESANGEFAGAQDDVSPLLPPPLYGKSTEKKKKGSK